ncbi:DUF3301 domain-containing protein [Pseudomonadota bacterium]
MMLSHLIDMFILFLLGFVGVFWWKTQDVKPYALRAAQKRCEEEGLQLLDQSVVLRRARLRRDSRGRMHICRRFVFEFSSTGDERYKGYVETMGTQVVSISLAAHRI